MADRLIQLCLAVLMLAAEKHNSTPFAPVSIRPISRLLVTHRTFQIGIGLTLLVCHLYVRLIATFLAGPDVPFQMGCMHRNEFP
jgi:hypothetical protein